MLRQITPADVVIAVHKHAYEKNRSLGSGLVSYALDIGKNMSDDEAIARLKHLGYTATNVAEDAVKCARSCITFSKALAEQGYTWDAYNRTLVRPVPKVL